jgi:hypothetical protein
MASKLVVVGFQVFIGRSSDTGAYSVPHCFQAAGSQTSHILHLIVPLIEESLTGPAKEHFEEDGMVL